jgi:hypothetical protein
MVLCVSVSIEELTGNLLSEAARVILLDNYEQKSAD